MLALVEGHPKHRYHNFLLGRVRDTCSDCVYRKLNPNILMMKSAQDGVRTYDAGSLNRTRDRRILVQ